MPLRDKPAELWRPQRAAIQESLGRPYVAALVWNDQIRRPRYRVR
jgi:hypothetical protein